MFRPLTSRFLELNKNGLINTKRRITHRFDALVPEKFKPLWHHPAGPQTVFFWAPLFKWGLVIAGLSDLNRDPSTISASQTTILMITGLIWSRYSMVITPKNYLLFSVNMAVSITQLIQLIKLFKYGMST